MQAPWFEAHGSCRTSWLMEKRQEAGPPGTGTLTLVQMFTMRALARALARALRRELVADAGADADEGAVASQGPARQKALMRTRKSN